MGVENGKFVWADLEYFSSLNPARHALVHFFTGFATVTIGLFIWFRVRFRNFIKIESL